MKPALAVAPPTGPCALSTAITDRESDLICALIAATRHLEQARDRAVTPDTEAARYPQPITAAALRSRVLGNADRLRCALDDLTAPYEQTDRPLELTANPPALQGD